MNLYIDLDKGKYNDIIILMFMYVGLWIMDYGCILYVLGFLFEHLFSYSFWCRFGYGFSLGYYMDFVMDLEMDLHLRFGMQFDMSTI